MVVVTTFSRSFLDSSTRWSISFPLLCAVSSLFSSTAIWSGDSLLRFSSRNFLVLAMTSCKALALAKTSFCRALGSDGQKSMRRGNEAAWFQPIVITKQKVLLWADDLKPGAPPGTAADLWHFPHYPPAADDQSDDSQLRWGYHTLPPAFPQTPAAFPAKTVRENTYK